jgi:conjugative relaxase-like TrwC/TraI family protein
MLTAASVANAGGASNYYLEQDNYYLRDEGVQFSEWFGEGAKLQGLEGKVDEDDFRKVLGGLVDNQVLGRIIKNEQGERQFTHRAGDDFTFSAPKSVSIIALAHPDNKMRETMREAHNETVRAVLNYAEKNFAEVRKSTPGQEEKTILKTGNLTAALFHHDTSRDLDPQLHTHAVIANMSKHGDKWQALYNKDLFKNKETLGRLYSSVLAEKVQSMGYKITETDKRGNFEIAGIGKEIRDAFSSRDKAIREHLEGKGIDYEKATEADKKIAWQNTREKKTNVSRTKLREQWAAKLQNIDLKIQKQVNHQKISAEEAVKFAIRHVSTNEATFSKNEITKAAISHIHGRGDALEIDVAIAKMVERGALIQKGDKFTTRQNIKSEEWALSALGKNLNAMKEFVAAPKLDKAIQTGQQKAFGKKNSINLTQGQINGIKVALSTKSRFVGINGLAGTGKTTALNVLREIASDKGIKITALAPTGRAVEELKNGAGLNNAKTLASFLVQKKQESVSKPFFGRNKEIWLVDESSMINQKNANQLMALAEKHDSKIVFLGDIHQMPAVERGKPFESLVNAGMKTEFLTEITRQKTAETRAVIGAMVGRDNNIVKPENILTTEGMKKAFSILEEQKKIVVNPDNALLREKIAQDFLSKTPEERNNTIIVTPFNRDREAITDLIRTGLKATGEINQNELKTAVLLPKALSKAQMRHAQYFKIGDNLRIGKDYESIGVKKGDYFEVKAIDRNHNTLTLSNGEKTVSLNPSQKSTFEVYEKEEKGFSVGDKVAIRRNEKGLANRQTGFVTAIIKNQMSITLDSGKTITRNLSEKSQQHLDHAHVSTVYSSQGATFKNVMVHVGVSVSPKGLSEGFAKFFGDKAAYVALSRAKESMSIYTTDKDNASAAFATKQLKTTTLKEIGKEHLEKINFEKDSKEIDKVLNQEVSQQQGVSLSR